MKTASRKQEEKHAARYGGRRTPGSGNGLIKNDVRTVDESWELKTTSAKQYILKSTDLVLAEKYALQDGRDMRFKIDMCGRSWVVMSEEDYEVLKEKATRGSEA
ncbi:hypothetical protein GCM10010149_88870 [Nonomuraea roseoviolacea subsp. roseoviolacea]|uniref:hypothetical protein n=1 Tax=Nonomuraea roseoviolacea TaxID=103837 RepID=UPI0031CF2563